MRQEGLKFKVSLGYIARLCLKKKKKMLGETSGQKNRK
jgi:hypothetical protein